ncbi:MAG: hypothetical protein HXY37_08930 [Chloroflexi bacterium]|nr:hypothetical protein [Chloroflexota bacterium]
MNSFLAARKGFTVGQEVTLETPQGPRSYTVADVGTDYLNSRAATVCKELLDSYLRALVAEHGRLRLGKLLGKEQSGRE